MTKIYPNKIDDRTVAAAVAEGDSESESVVLTVWKKSLLFNCEGFTVFDPQGNLVYRVDNYMSASKGHIFLMDASGATLLTIRRKRLALGDTWLLYDGDTADRPIFSVRRNLLPHLPLNNSSRCLAHVTSASDRAHKLSKYEIEGSYGRRSCAVYDAEKGRRVAEIRQKEASVRGVAFGKDVFRLVVHPGFDAPLAMAIVILLDQMFGSS